MSLASRTIRSSAWAFSSAQVAGAMSFVVSIVAARLLAPEVIGQYALVTVVVALATAAASLQMGGYYVVAERATPRLLRTGLTLELGIGAAMLVLVAAAALIYGSASGRSEVALVVIVASTVLLSNPFGSLSAFFTRDLRYRPVSVAQAACVTIAALTKVLLLAVGAGIWALVVGDVVLSICFGGVMLALVPAGRGFALDRELIKKQLGFGVPSLATGLLSNASARLPEVAIAAVLGTREVGFYYIASRIPAQLYQLGRSLSLALLPAFSRATDEQLGRAFTATVRLSAFFIGLPVAVVLVFAEPFVTSVYGDVWEAAAMPLVLLTCATAIRFVLWHVGNLLKARRRVREMTWLGAAHLALLVATVPIGAYTADLVGACVAVLAVELVLVPARLLLARSVVEMRLGEALHRPAMAVVAAAGVGAAAQALLAPLPAVVVGVLAATAVFAVLLWRSDGRSLAEGLGRRRVPTGV